MHDAEDDAGIHPVAEHDGDDAGGDEDEHQRVEELLQQAAQGPRPLRAA